MAKRGKFRYAGGGRPIVVRSSSPKIIKVSAPRSVIGRARRVASRFGHAAAKAAYEEKHRLVACLTAGFIGYAEKEGWDLPGDVLGLGVPATWGLGLWFAQKNGWIRNKTLSHATTGLLAVASYKFGKGDVTLNLTK